MLKGMGNISKRLRLEMDRSARDIESGMMLAVAHVKGESMEVVPVEYGVLANSAFTDTEINANFVTGRVGYTVEYAPYVHEMPSTYNFTKPGTGPKFLEKPLEDNIKTVESLIAGKARR